MNLKRIQGGGEQTKDWEHFAACIGTGMILYQEEKARRGVLKFCDFMITQKIIQTYEQIYGPECSKIN